VSTNFDSSTPLAYTGIDSTSQPSTIAVNRAPLPSDWQSFYPGDFWRDTSVNPPVTYILESVSGNVAVWRALTSTIPIPVTVPLGGTSNISFTPYAPITGGTASTNPFQSADANIANVGYVLTSAGASALPTWEPNSASAGIETINTISPAVGGNFSINGSTNIAVNAGTNAIGLAIIGQIPGANGGTGIANTGLTINLGSGTAGAVLTSDLSGNAAWAAIPSIGTITQYDVLVGGASSQIVSVGPGSAGQPLLSGGASANPVYSTTFTVNDTIAQALESKALVAGAVQLGIENTDITSASSAARLTISSALGGGDTYALFDPNGTGPINWELGANAAGNFLLTNNATTGTANITGDNYLIVNPTDPGSGDYGVWNFYTPGNGTSLETIGMGTSNPGNPIRLSVYQNSAAANSDAYIEARVNASTTGDAYMVCVGGLDWTFGEDRSAGLFKFGHGGSPSNFTNTFYTIDTVGNISFYSGSSIFQHTTSGGYVQLGLQNLSSSASSTSRFAINTNGSGGPTAHNDAYILFDQSVGSGGAFELGLQQTTNTFQIQSGPSNTNPYMDGTTVFSITQAGVPKFPLAGTPASGYVLTSDASGNGTWQANAPTPGVAWVEVTGTSQTMAIDTGYIANNAGLVTLTLPAVGVQGAVIEVVGKGAGGWKIAQNAGQIIYYGEVNTTTGVTGYISSTKQRDTIKLVCTTANNEWTVNSVVGNPLYN
jgi:hypothetical protein